jgi:hypothetical protein
MMTAAVPKGLKPAGRRLWRAVVEAYELSDHELELLGTAARTADLLAVLAADIAANGVIDPENDRVRATVVEHRAQSIALARLLAALRLPDGSARSQRRGIRGVYAVAQ